MQPTAVRLYQAALSVRLFPKRGRIGQRAGTRELLVASLPYVIVYRTSAEAVHIMRILHTSQDRP